MLDFLGWHCFREYSVKDSYREGETEGPGFTASKINSLWNNTKSGRSNFVHKASHSSTRKHMGTRKVCNLGSLHHAFFQRGYRQPAWFVGGSSVHGLMVGTCDMTGETNKGLGSSQNHIYLFIYFEDLFIYLKRERERQRERARGEGQREKERVS